MIAKKHIFTVCACFLLVLLASGKGFGQWKELGPYGGGAHVVAISQDLLVVGTRNAQLYKSTDQAATWHSVLFPKSLSATLNALLIDRCNAQTWYVGLADSGIFKTVDGGRSWVSLPGIARESVSALAAFPSDCRMIAAGTMTGVMISDDGGDTWNRISPLDHSDLHPVVSLAFDSTSRDILYAGTPHLPWKTTDGGQTWIPIHVGLIDDSDILSIAVRGSRVLIGACSGIYISIDEGKHFRKTLGIPGASRRTYDVEIDPHDSRLIYAGTSNGLWKSIDAGLTWQRKSTAPARSIALDSRRLAGVVIATDSGISKSKPGSEELSAANTGFTNRRLGDLVDLNPGLLASVVYEIGNGTLTSSMNRDMNWTNVGSPGQQIFMFARNDRAVFASSLRDVFRSIDKGKTWKALAGGFKGTITALHTVSGGRSLLVGTTEGLFIGAENGLSWKRLPVAAVKSIRTSPDGLTWGVATPKGILVSIDNGTTWTPVQFPDEDAMNDFAIRSQDELVVAGFRGLAFTRDGGAHWDSPSHGLVAGTVTSVLWHPSDVNLMFAVQFGNVYESSDRGMNWRSLDNGGMSGDSVSELRWSADHSELLAVTFARGVFVRNASAP